MLAQSSKHHVSVTAALHSVIFLMITRRGAARSAFGGAERQPASAF
jgi:hypothetical protein